MAGSTQLHMPFVLRSLADSQAYQFPDAWVPSHPADALAIGGLSPGQHGHNLAAAEAACVVQGFRGCSGHAGHGTCQPGTGRLQGMPRMLVPLCSMSS